MKKVFIFLITLVCLLQTLRADAFHPDYQTYMTGISNQGQFVELHDYSLWEVASSSRKKIVSWEIAEQIVIKPSACCLPDLFSKHPFVFHNRIRNEVVWVKLKEIGEKGGYYPHRVVASGPANYLTLSDGSLWLVDLSEGSKMPRNGQEIMIGVNNQWKTAAYPYILIIAKPHTHDYLKAYFISSRS